MPPHKLLSPPRPYSMWPTWTGGCGCRTGQAADFGRWLAAEEALRTDEAAPAAAAAEGRPALEAAIAAADRRRMDDAHQVRFTLLLPAMHSRANHQRGLPAP